MAESLNNNRDYLKLYQYQDSSNLSARILIHSLFSTAQQVWEDFIFNYIPFEENLALLALGSGSAVQWRKNKDRFRLSNQIFLTDISLGMVKEVSDTLSGNTCFKSICMDAMEISFPNNSFDFVTANHMLYHVPYFDTVLSEIIRVLKRDGKMMAATNGPSHMIELDQLLEKFDGRFQGKHAMSDQFNLSNGEAKLRPYFEQVRVVMYPSDLWVTDPGLLASYAFSTPRVKNTIPTDRFEDLKTFFEEIVQKEGGIFIRKQTGIFLAEKPRT